MSPPDALPGPADVVVVGFGPVGQVLAVLLAQRGWRTVVLERQPRPYPLPRAVSYDGHAARLLAATGIGPAPASESMPSPDYRVVDAAGRTLLHVPLRAAGSHGWPDATSVHQPSLEQRLAHRAAQLPALQVWRGVEALDVREHDDRVAVLAQDVATGARREVRARWAVGCDGAGSVLRTLVGAELVDAGFSCDWLACDVLPHDPAQFPPSNLQIADPGRPRVAVTAGPSVRRWEFMRLPEEPVQAFDTVERAWELLGLFGVTADRAQLLRRATYRVRAVNADRWRSGRLFLAGDAAHQMPPFAGQGMCSGLRDAANLAWKLDLVLRGAAHEDLLDSYERERRSDVQQAVDLSVGLGRLVCGPVGGVPAADERPSESAPDAGSAGAGRDDVDDGAPSLPGPLRSGVLRRHGPYRDAGAGTLSPHPRVRAPGGPERLDELARGAFVLLTGGPVRLPERHRAMVRRLGLRVVQVHPASPTAPDRGAGGDDAGGVDAAVVDVEDVYLPWLRRLDAVAVLLRPDHYVFGRARDPADLACLLDDLAAQVGPASSSALPRQPLAGAARPGAPSRTS